jgi:hypothetical protein
MPEWWSYRLSDFLMFEPRTYYRLFELYNHDVWPGQILALMLGLVLLGLGWRGGPARGRAAAAILCAAWLWVAWAFHWRRYATINLAAGYFAGLFAIQALLMSAAVVRRGVAQPPPRKPDAIGLGVTVFAVVFQPLIGPLLGRAWTGVETFGMAPDPTAAATLGILLIGAARRALWIIPLLWCMITGATLWAMDAPDAGVMPLVAVVAVSRAVWQRRMP